MITNRSTSAVAPAMAEPIQAAARATNGGIEVSPRACMKPKLGLSLSDMLTLLISGGTVGAGRDLSMASCRKAAGEERSAPGGSPALPPAPAVTPTCTKLGGASVVGVAVLASNSAPGGGSGRHWYTSRALMDQNACFSSSGWYWMRSAHDIRPSQQSGRSTAVREPRCKVRATLLEVRLREVPTEVQRENHAHILEVAGRARPVLQAEERVWLAPAIRIRDLRDDVQGLTAVRPEPGTDALADGVPLACPSAAARGIKLVADGARGAVLRAPLVLVLAVGFDVAVVGCLGHALGEDR
mmetsp:Transcript_60570/g.196248  ORF Transcript_60570/g.196248 Transcript_60570/m.196248 type:complete len:298 (-) Transcript_60570:727-1620(-)